MKVELIYDADCPNADAAREVLAEALERVGRPLQWVEWNRADPEAPAHVRGYGSPAVLVEGRDVAGIEGQGRADACRIYDGPSGLRGVPPREAIIAALKAAGAEPARSREQRRGGWWAIGVAAAAAVPTLLPVGICPACWPAYAGLLGAMGLGFVFESRYLLPLMVVFFALALVALGYRARSRRGLGPLMLGAAAVVWTLVFKFAVPMSLASYLGLGGLLAASVWNAWPKNVPAAGSCPHCVCSASDSP